MFVLGLLSVIQIVFLPGYLALRCLKLDKGAAGTLILSFALSLVINYFLVFLLVLFHIYNSPVMYCVFALETGILLWTMRNSSIPTIAEVITSCLSSIRAFLEECPKFWDDKGGILRCFIYLSAVGALIAYAIHGFMSFGEIFLNWDAVISWNRWAIEWAGGAFPKNTAEYPQLLPANWSITYVFIQDTTIWFFAKATTPWFCFFLLLAILDLRRALRDDGYALGMLFTFGLLSAIIRFPKLDDGYAEVPVAFFAFLVVYVLILARLSNEAMHQRKYIFLAALMCGGAALTKQAGLFMAAVYPCLLWLIVFRCQTVQAVGNLKRRFTLLITATLLILLMAGSWYVYKYVEISFGKDASIVYKLVHDIHEGRSLMERLAFANAGIVRYISLPVALVLVGFIAFSLKDLIQRKCTIIVVIPFYLIWCMFFSYDNRNVALAIPFAGVAAGVGARCMFETLDIWAARFRVRLLDYVPNIFKAKIAYLAVLLLLTAAILDFAVPRTALVARQNDLLRSVGYAELDLQLYEYDARYGINDDVLTDYPFLAMLPDLNKHYYRGDVDNFVLFQRSFQQPSVGYVLCHRKFTVPQVWAYLDEYSRSGKGRFVLDNDFYRMFKKEERR